MKLVLQEIKFIFPNMSVHHTVNTIYLKLHLHIKYTNNNNNNMIVLLLLNEFSTNLYIVFLNCTNMTCNFIFTHAHIYTHFSFGSFLISTALFRSLCNFFKNLSPCKLTFSVTTDNFKQLISLYCDLLYE